MAKTAVTTLGKVGVNNKSLEAYRTIVGDEPITERFGWDKWRELLWSKVEGNNILEVGVGTGKNFSYYPPDADITAILFNPFQS